ncbi:RidA family protein [Lacisediminihabitans sp.]|uniref:RidA family protein n=1 Tax=Lacisediminihabitans sp. TaxID=2787631 RepID=UPI002F958BF8
MYNAVALSWSNVLAPPDVPADMPPIVFAMRNVLAVLAEAGTGPEYAAKLTIYLAVGVDPGVAYAATRSVWGDHRTAVTVLAVTPARPGALVEIEAVATLPDR